MNATRPLAYPTNVPFYHTDRPSLIPNISDTTSALAAPILAYWVLSLFFHALDMSGWKWLEKYRLHDSAEVKSKNLATRSQVIWAVILQQVIQTGLGLVWVTEGKHVTSQTRTDAMHWIGEVVMDIAWTVLGKRLGTKFLHARGADAVYFVYWWAIPAAQFFLAMFVIDTWQYFLHRLMHVNKWLYKQFHSTHHRLYVPYAFGALYNHPVEGFLLDSLGAVLGEALSMMSVRQTILFFAFSTLKTVDDHCGYNFPCDPLQFLCGNNADYHDIHHQVIGIKSNFSQPFFIHWDTILGTRMTRADIQKRRQEVKKSL
ncbi:hypothetical protein FIBSPDRAFT_887171 [Athelia psychrophila]|uniref:Fatty acid hydroxylase domain-containing protein n=1 Tax=Athelia psychrophila TaxID=1759441 RepID=A0A166Q295_9AGAM|nr:hypothetical protein FIBSPDRAFT_887171 [Fibularhizoctonia sp. CBS 109695]